MGDDSRRRFLRQAGTLGAGGALALASGAAAAGHGGGEWGAYRMSADREKVCATCVFWGGMRRVTADRSEVLVKSLGYCNNPASPNYRRMTSPDTGPMNAWVRWPALEG